MFAMCPSLTTKPMTICPPLPLVSPSPELEKELREQKMETQKWKREVEDSNGFFKDVVKEQGQHVWNASRRTCEICKDAKMLTNFLRFPCMHDACCTCTIEMLNEGEDRTAKCHLCKTGPITQENCVQYVNLSFCMKTSEVEQPMSPPYSSHSPRYSPYSPRYAPSSPTH